MINNPNIQAQLRDLAANNIVTITASGAPTDTVTGATIAGIGSEYIDMASGIHYFNKGTLASPVWKAVTTA